MFHDQKRTKKWHEWKFRAIQEKKYECGDGNTLLLPDVRIHNLKGQCWEG